VQLGLKVLRTAFPKR